MNKKHILTDLSVSMFLDSDKDLSPTLKDNYLRFSSDLNERKRYNWVKDDTINNCQNCNTLFTILLRKHHCRYCGKIFCYKCANNFINISNINDDIPKQVWNIKSYFNFSDTHRVCDDCNITINNLKSISKLLTVFELLPLDIKDYKNISLVSKSWNLISKYYYSSFREIQYYFPDHIYTKKDKNILRLNRRYFVGHSKWITQLILSTDWENENQSYIDECMEIIENSNRNTSCWELMCTRSCSCNLECEDLFLLFSRKLTYGPIIYKLIDKLKQCNINELSCYLSWFINLMNYYKDYSNISETLENVLIDKCIKSKNICNQLFWVLTQNIRNNLTSSDYFKKFRFKLVSHLSNDLYKLFQNGFDFTTSIINIAENNEGNICESIKKYLLDNDFNTDRPFYLPIDFDKCFHGISINDIKIIDSKTKPIILPCNYPDNQSIKKYEIMLKKEDIRKENIIMQMISLMDIILKNEESIDFNVVVYKILPISEKYGYIEFVPSSKTLYSIKEELGFTIQNYILEKHSDLIEFRDKFIKSCAAYTVITYLLGIGDRHLDNIMLTDDGKLFHIDYGYILGKDPKPVSPEFRITPEMIDAMGGKTSNNYEKFKKYCGNIYNCLRRHAPVFYTMLISLTEFHPSLEDRTLTKDYIHDFVMTRFVPGESYKEAELQFRNKIEQNSNTYSENIIDFFHKTYRSDSNSKTDDKNKGILNYIAIPFWK